MRWADLKAAWNFMHNECAEKAHSFGCVVDASITEVKSMGCINVFV